MKIRVDQIYLNKDYRIRLVNGKGYINVERVCKNELHFNVSINKHYYACIESLNPNSWHFRLKGNCQKRITNKNYPCYTIEERG